MVHLLDQTLGFCEEISVLVLLNQRSEPYSPPAASQCHKDGFCVVISDLLRRRRRSEGEVKFTSRRVGSCSLHPQNGENTSATHGSSRTQTAIDPAVTL